jgi:hypothetical protein
MTVNLRLPRKGCDWSFFVLVTLDAQAGELEGETSQRNVDNTTTLHIAFRGQSLVGVIPRLVQVQARKL